MSLDDSSSSESTKSPALQVPKKRKRELQPGQDEIEIDVLAPEPPSKKALRKTKKKGPTATFGSTSKSPNENPPSQDERNGTPDTNSNVLTQKKSEHGIWIGNLPWTTTKDDLLRFLTSTTAISEEHVTRIHMPIPKEAAKNEISSGLSSRRLKPQNKGFAYIDFSTELAKTQAIALSEKLLTGRAVLIKDALSFEGRPKPTGQELGVKIQPGKAPARRIFVGNLAFDVTKEDVEQHFAKCGHIEEVFLASFEDSGKCKGYGWVTFTSLEAASAAVQGWVSMEAETEEDENKDSEAHRDRQNKEKRRKPMKWWVNRMRGRSLRVEYAEDPTTRYNKRFGREAKATKEAVEVAEDSALRDGFEEEQSKKPSSIATGNLHESLGGKGSGQSQDYKAYKKMNVPSGAVSRVLEKMRGNIVVAEGKKTTFE